MRRLKISPKLIDKHGYPELTDAIKSQIFGLNAARLMGIDPAANRKAIKADKLSMMREESRQHPDPSRTQYGWVWKDDGTEPTAPVGG